MSFKESVCCSIDCVQGSKIGYIIIPKFSSGTSFCHGTKKQSHFMRGLKYRFLEKWSKNNNKDLCKQWYTSFNGTLRFKKSVFVVSIVYKAQKTDILSFQNFLMEHLFAMGPKNNHILCGDLIIDFSKNDKKNRKCSRGSRLLKPLPKIKRKRAHKRNDQKQLNFWCFLLKFWMWNRGSENKIVRPLWSLFESKWP